jgi:hypothetical protein
MQVSPSAYYAWLKRPAKLITGEELHLHRFIELPAVKFWGQVAGLVQKSNLCASQWFLSPK